MGQSTCPQGWVPNAHVWIVCFTHSGRLPGGQTPNRRFEPPTADGQPTSSWRRSGVVLGCSIVKGQVVYARCFALEVVLILDGEVMGRICVFCGPAHAARSPCAGYRSLAPNQQRKQVPPLRHSFATTVHVCLVVLLGFQGWAKIFWAWGVGSCCCPALTQEGLSPFFPPLSFLEMTPWLLALLALHPPLAPQPHVQCTDDGIGGSALQGVCFPIPCCAAASASATALPRVLYVSHVHEVCCVRSRSRRAQYLVWAPVRGPPSRALRLRNANAPAPSLGPHPGAHFRATRPQSDLAS